MVMVLFLTIDVAFFGANALKLLDGGGVTLAVSWAVFMTAQPTGTPPALAHNLQYNKVLHKHVVVLTVTTAQTPHVAEKDRVSVTELEQGVFNLRLQYGFMEDPDVPAALLQAREQGLDIDLEDLAYFLGRETILVTRKEGMALWREKLFVLMARNAVRPISYFH